MAIWPYIMCKYIYIYIYIFILSRHSHTIYTVPVNGLHSALLSKTCGVVHAKLEKTHRYTNLMLETSAVNIVGNYIYGLYNRCSLSFKIDH